MLQPDPEARPLPPRPALRTVAVGRAPHPAPSLRGLSHFYAFVLSLVAGATLVWLAPTRHTMLGALVYAGGISAMLCVSALYHRLPWSPRAARLVRRLDHSLIYICMATSYTALWMVPLAHTAVTDTVLVLVWLFAAAGAAFKLVWIDVARRVSSATYIGFGVVGIATLPEFVTAATSFGVAMFLAGGACQAVGAVVYALGWPNPSPEHFGYHEVFHALVVVGLVLQYAVLGGFIVSAG